MENKKELLAESLVKKGYKKTKLGWIPEEWGICKGIDITERITKGASPKWQGFNYQKEGVLFVTSENVRTGYLDISTPKFLPLSFNEKQKSSVLKSGDILINIVGASIGRSCLFQELVTANINQAVSVFRPNSKVNKEYLLQFLNFEITVKRLLGIQSDGARPNLSLTDLKLFQFLLPPLPEQQKIAKILSTWDKAIDKLNQLITQKEKHKKGLMQVLLTGKIRFDGFTEEWEEVKLGEVLTIGSGKDYKHLAKGIVPVYGTGGLMTYVDDYLFDGESVGIGRKGTIDKPMYLSGKFWTVDTLFFTHTFCNTIPKYIYFLFLTINWYKYNEASGVPSLSKKTIDKIEVKLPSIKEQQKIASILSSVDATIEKLNAQLEVLKNQKKGLMQELLTGKTRVKIN